MRCLHIPHKYKVSTYRCQAIQYSRKQTRPNPCCHGVDIHGSWPPEASLYDTLQVHEQGQAESLRLPCPVFLPLSVLLPRYQDCVKIDFETQKIIQYLYSLTLGAIMPGVRKSKFCWIQPSRICLENDKHTEI